jgi:hypothetical protein
MKRKGQQGPRPNPQPALTPHEGKGLGTTNVWFGRAPKRFRKKGPKVVKSISCACSDHFGYP